MFINECKKVIEMTKSENRAAHTYGTPEYDNLQEVRKAYPGFRVVVKERKQVDRLKGLDVPYMKKYILEHDSQNTENWKDFCKLRGLDEKEEKLELSVAVPFGELRMWFLATYPEVEELATSVEAILDAAKKARAAKKANAMKNKAITGL